MEDSVVDFSPIVTIRYRNWKGEEALRRVLPNRIFFGVTPFHPEPQWLMDGFDCDKRELRTFALSGVLEWGSPEGVLPSYDDLANGATFPAGSAPEPIGK
jgi:hypothetical protein